MLSLYVDSARWRAHLHSVVERHPGVVPVCKGNGYGFGLSRLGAEATALGVDTIAVGTYGEVEQALAAFPGSVMVLTPWRPFETRASYDDRVVHTVGREEDLVGLAAAGAAAGSRPRVVLELLTSMLRHGFTPAGPAGGRRRRSTAWSWRASPCTCRSRTAPTSGRCAGG